MDTSKLFKDLVNNKDLQDIPILYISRVAIAVLKLIQGNKYTYRIGE